MSTRRPVRAAASGLCLLAVLASSDRSRPAEAAAPPATGRAATAIGTCDGRQLGEWQFVAREQMRVQARGRSGNDWVGLTAATDGFHDWAPFDDFKTTICGALGIFGTFEPTREKEFLRFLPEIPEHDWNVILIPTARSIFDERFRLARRLMERGHEGDLVSCQGTPCFEAEVTPRAGCSRRTRREDGSPPAGAARRSARSGPGSGTAATATGPRSTPPSASGGGTAIASS